MLRLQIQRLILTETTEIYHKIIAEVKISSAEEGAKRRDDVMRCCSSKIHMLKIEKNNLTLSNDRLLGPKVSEKERQTYKKLYHEMYAKITQKNISPGEEIENKVNDKIDTDLDSKIKTLKTLKTNIKKYTDEKTCVVQESLMSKLEEEIKDVYQQVAPKLHQINEDIKTIGSQLNTRSSIGAQKDLESRLQSAIEARCNIMTPKSQAISNPH